MAQDAFDVYLDGKHIDTVFASVGAYDAEEMKKSLINHDGYSSGIEVEVVDLLDDATRRKVALKFVERKVRKAKK